MQSTHGIDVAERLLLPRAQSARVAKGINLDHRSRISLGASSAGCTFLSAYMLIHAQHVAHADFALVSCLSSIPLFATLLASSAAAITVGVCASTFVRNPEPLLARMPRLISVLSLLFTLEILAFP